MSLPTLRRLFPLTLMLGLLPAAHAEVRVSIDPLPYGAVQLSYNQYMIPNVNGINILVYSDRPLPFAEPGRPYASKQNVVIDPLPYGAVRMNDTQYLLRDQGMTVMLMANSPLAFKQTSLTMPDSAPSVANAAAQPDFSPPSNLGLTAILPQPVAATPIPGSQSLPAQTQPPAQAPQTTANSRQTVQNILASLNTKKTAQEATPPRPSEPLVTEIRTAAPVRRERVNFSGLPAGVDGYVLAREENGQIKLAYSILNGAQDTYILNPVKLSLRQNGSGLRANLDRRNGSLAPGVIPSGQGEMGTITLNRVTNAPINLTWTMQNQTTGENYQLSYTY